MALTPAQWDKAQSSLPQEDRIPYLEYLKIADPAEYKIRTTPVVKSSALQNLKTAEAKAATPAKVSVSAAESAAAAKAKAAAEKKAAEAQAAADKAILEAGLGGEAEGDRLAALAAAQEAEGDRLAKAEAAKAEADRIEAARLAALTAQQRAAEEAAAKAAAEKAAREAAEKAAREAEAKAEQERIAAEKAITEARTAAELQAAKDAQLAAEAANAAAKAELEKLKREAEAALKAEQARAAAELKAAQDKAAADLKAAEAAGNAKAIETAKAAKAAADKAAADAKAASDAAAQAAAQAAAEAKAAEAETNINVTGNTVIPFAGSTAADIAAQLAADQALEQKMADRIATSQMLADRFQKYNLSSLAPKIKELAINGANEATIMLELQETEEYKQRFKANQERIKKNLAVLDPGTYLRVEDGYRQVLRSYGLNQFDTDDYVSKFIANDMSPTEFSNRVVTAVQRVQNADPALIKQLNDFYGINSQGLLAYVLDPEQEFPKIERQIAAGEIGLAASRQGLTAGVSVAEQLAAQGISEAEARKGYATIADILPTAEKLSDIYGTTMDTYGQSEAEQEVFNSLASAQRKRQRLTAREVAAFSGSAGTNKTSLSTSRVGQYQNPERTYRPRQRNRPTVGASQFPRTELWPAN